MVIETRNLHKYDTENTFSYQVNLNFKGQKLDMSNNYMARMKNNTTALHFIINLIITNITPLIWLDSWLISQNSIINYFRSNFHVSAVTFSIVIREHLK